MNRDSDIPQISKIIDILPETPDISTFVIDNSDKKIVHQPGQFALLTPVFGQGEIVISISSKRQSALVVKVQNALVVIVFLVVLNVVKKTVLRLLAGLMIQKEWTYRDSLGESLDQERSPDERVVLRSAP